MEKKPGPQEQPVVKAPAGVKPGPAEQPTKAPAATPKKNPLECCGYTWVSAENVRVHRRERHIGETFDE